jgi:hypothetical protein
VDTYVSNRPDGFKDVLSSDRMTISNVTGTYNSAFTNNMFSGFGFPQIPYKNISLENVLVTDTAPTSVRMPMTTSGLTANENIVFKNVRGVINRWSGAGVPVPVIAGAGNSIAMDVSILGTASHIMMAASPGLELTLQATPIKVKTGDKTTLNWLARGATSCSANGAWAGSVPNGGTRVMTPGAAGSYEYVFYCQNPGNASSVVMPVVVAD